MSTGLINTKNGKVRGKVVTLNNISDGKPVHVFRRIPFAKPPIGNLRFMPPQPVDPWNGEIDGTSLGPKPMASKLVVDMMSKLNPTPVPDGEITYSEDCLHLSVYTPVPSTERKYPVMVWLYGGGFFFGSEADYDPSALVGLNDVVVVIPNYRVGMFGFFSLGQHSKCTGNAGLLDQQMALRWVQENIEHFGGDRGNITIFGVSAGGVCVHFNMVSPLSKDLFHKAISHSGQISMKVLLNSEEQNNQALEATLKHFKIEEEEHSKILAALQSLPAEELIKAQDINSQKQIQFRPMVDGVFFLKNPVQSLAEKDFHKIPYIIGCNSTEASGILGLHSGSEFLNGFSEQKARQIMGVPFSDAAWREIRTFYRPNQASPTGFSKLFSDVFHDMIFAVPAIYDAKVHADSGASVYVYLANFQLKMFHDDEYGKDFMRRPYSCICDHGDDVYMTFGLPFCPNGVRFDVKFTKKEEILSRKWMIYLTNFAKTGSPNEGVHVDKEWPKTEKGILIVDHEFAVTKKYKEKEVKFWRGKMRQLID